MTAELSRKVYSWNNNDQVIIKSADLIMALIEDQAGAIADLSTIVSPIALSDITVDDYGTVIVTNAAFKTKVESSFSSGPGGLATGVNVGACGNVRCLSLVG